MHTLPAKKEMVCTAYPTRFRQRLKENDRVDPLGSLRVGEEEIHFHMFLLLLGAWTQEPYEYEGNARAKKTQKRRKFPSTGTGS